MYSTDEISEPSEKLSGGSHGSVRVNSKVVVFEVVSGTTSTPLTVPVMVNVYMPGRYGVPYFSAGV